LASLRENYQFLFRFDRPFFWPAAALISDRIPVKNGLAAVMISNYDTSAGRVDPAVA